VREGAARDAECRPLAGRVRSRGRAPATRRDGTYPPCMVLLGADAADPRPLTGRTYIFYYSVSKKYERRVIMTQMSLTPSDEQPLGTAGLTAEPPLTLAEEHVLLLWQVTESAEKLLTAAEHGRWPGAELAALAGYAQAEVLRQASDEEALLFPAVPAQTAAGLARDHARLRAAAELLSRAAAGEQAMSPAQVATAVRDFTVQLERHLRNEDGLLAPDQAPRGVPGTVHLGARPHEWYPLTEGPVVDLDALPPDQAAAAATDRLLRMHRGEQVELQWSTDLDPVWREINELSPGGYRFAVLQDGPARWRMQVTRRQAAT
jgi:uncharacterized protein (DUF2249 family)